MGLDGGGGSGKEGSFGVFGGLVDLGREALFGRHGCGMVEEAALRAEPTGL